MKKHFPEIRLVVAAETEATSRVLGFRWADPKVGTRHKLGGEPDWVQGEDVPACDSCQTAMTFYGQLDSVGDNMYLADCGLVYVFVCIDCFASKSIVQSS